MRDMLNRIRPVSAGLLIFLALGLLLWLAACVPSIGGIIPTNESSPKASQSPLPQSYSFYIYDWTKDEGLVPVDPETLDDLPGGHRLGPGTFSADGSTGVIQEYIRGRASTKPEHIWIVVTDLQSGAERSRFHPPAKGFIAGLSADGSRLLLRPEPYPPQSYPPLVEYYLLDTASGETLAHLEDPDNACFRQLASLDPAGRRLYCAVDPDLEERAGPQPLQVVAYDLESGEKTAVVEVPEALIGGEQIERQGTLVEEFFEPTLVLSPDGSKLAIVHAEADKVTLLDTQDLAVERSFSLGRSTTLGDLFGPRVAYAKGEMSGTVRQAQFSLDGTMLYVFTQQVVATGEEPPEERGLWLVDLERGLIRAEGVLTHQVQWVVPGPDGAVYAFGTTDERLWPYQITETSPSTLWLLDGRTLEIQAERDFAGYRAGRLVFDKG